MKVQEKVDKEHVYYNKRDPAGSLINGDNQIHSFLAYKVQPHHD